MTPEAEKMLVRIYDNGGTWADRPIARRPFGRELMQLGLVELIKPDAPKLPYARLTRVGYQKAAVLKAEAKKV